MSHRGQFGLSPDISFSPAASATENECRDEPPKREDGFVWLEWAPTNTREAPVVHIRGTSQASIATVRARVRFGTLKYEWIQDRIPLEASEELDVPIVIPSEAFLHELSDRYVSDFTVQLWIGDDVFESKAMSLHGTYVAWPDGGNGEPVLWTEEEMQSFAPHGVLDPQLALLPPDAPADVRILPPVTQRIEDREPQPDISAEKEDSTFVDDQTDEGGE